MYGNKKLLTVVVCILIIALAFVPVRRANAVVPAIPVAVYYAIAAVGTAAGLYAHDHESINYFVSNYWNKSSEYVRKQWMYAAVYGYLWGKMIIDGKLTQTVIDNLYDEYEVGTHNVHEYIETDETSNLKKVTVNGISYVFGYEKRASNSYRVVVISDNEIVSYGSYNNRSLDEVIAEIATAYFYITANSVNWLSDYNGAKAAVVIPVGAIVKGYIEKIRSYTGDAGGFGAALAPDQEVKVPCPPIPAPEWPDRWIDDLEEDLNNTTAEQYVESMDNEFDWYVDKDGNIYKKPKGDPPEKEDDTKLVPPVPPPYQPIHPQPGEPGPATPDQPWVPADPCPYCPSEPGPAPDCPNPYCPNHPSPQAPPVPDPNTPADSCPYCPPNPDPGNNPCPNPYCPNNPAPVTPPSPKPQVGEPGGPPPKDDRYIDLEPLKKLPHIFTRKFPFSLPWDFYNSFKQLEGNVWDGKIDVNIQSALADFIFEIDLSIFNNIRHVVMKIELILFDIALILATRRLMGGGV